MEAQVPGKKIDYVLREDKDKKGKPKSGASIFKLKALSVEDYYMIQNATWQAGEGIGTGNLTVLTCGLLDWQEVRDENNELIPFKVEDEKCAIENLEYISSANRTELIAAIRDINAVSKAERKN